MNEDKFGQLRLSVKGTNSGRGFDIFYDFGKSHNFVEFTSKPEFYFIQPWMQFPAQAYTDECMRVSIELVHRFNDYYVVKKNYDNLVKNHESIYERHRRELIRREHEAYDAIVRIAEKSSPQEAIDYLRKLVEDNRGPEGPGTKQGL